MGCQKVPKYEILSKLLILITVCLKMYHFDTWSDIEKHIRVQTFGIFNYPFDQVGKKLVAEGLSAILIAKSIS